MMVNDTQNVREKRDDGQPCFFWNWVAEGGFVASFLLSFLPWGARKLQTCDGSGHVPKKMEYLRQLPLTTEHRP